MKKSLAKMQGYTLIELVAVIIILSIIAAIVSQILANGFNSFINAQKITDADWQGRAASERLVRDLRSVRSTADISAASSNQFTFNDVNGNNYSYILSAGSLTLNGLALADGISSFTFSYQDKNGNTTASIPAIRYVSFTFTVTQKGANYSLSSSVYLRDVA